MSYPVSAEGRVQAISEGCLLGSGGAVPGIRHPSNSRGCRYTGPEMDRHSALIHIIS